MRPNQRRAQKEYNSLTIFIYLAFCILSPQVSLGEPGAFSAAPSTHPDLDIKPSDVVHWSNSGARHDQSSGSLEIGLRLQTSGDWSIYKENLSLTPPPGFTLVKSVEPSPSKIVDPMSGEEKDVYTNGDFVLTYQGPPGITLESFPLAIKYLGCTTRICLFPYTETLQIPVFAAEPTAVIAELAPEKVPASEQIHPELASEEAMSPSGIESKYASALLKSALPFYWMLLIAFLGGLATNLTPCVLPMIPITVRLLGHRQTSPILASSTYAAGIFLMYTGLGISAAATGSLFGSLLANAWVNVAFALLMALMGLSMLGFGNFQMLQNIGQRWGTGKPSLKNNFLMGCGAGLVAAPCTGPILGALLTVITQSQDLGRGSALLGTYSLGFALPYVFLGSFSGNIGRIKVDERLVHFIKLTFASLMFALAFYYLRVPFYGLTKLASDHWVEILLGSILLSFILFALWLYSAKLRSMQTVNILMCILLGATMFAGSQLASNAGPTKSTAEIIWHRDLGAALELAKSSGRPIFIDAWAEWCEACKKMDRTTFVNPQVLSNFAEDEWILVKFDMTEMNDDHLEFQQKYEISGLPAYVMLSHLDGQVREQKVLSGYIEPQPLLATLREFLAVDASP